MAIGTLALCYNNVEVFRGVVKMRRDYGDLPPTGYVNSFRIAQMIPLRVRIIMK
ncbi:hypothetical protein BHE74_00006366, partial [Ensete ventricosum]